MVMIIVVLITRRIMIIRIIGGSLEAKLPTIWTDGKAPELSRSSDVEKIRKGDDAGARKGRSETPCFSIALWLRRVER